MATTGYTALRIVERGVVLRDLHLARLLEPFPASMHAELRARFDAFIASATPGIYRLTATEEALKVEARSSSALEPGQSIAFRVSPMAGMQGLQRKQPSPSPYDAVRTPGVTTLLTSEDGRELFESCVASVLAWNEGFVLPRATAPRIDSVSERWLATQVPHSRSVIAREGTWPLALVNAVAGVVPLNLPGRVGFPADALTQLRAAIDASTK